MPQFNVLRSTPDSLTGYVTLGAATIVGILLFEIIVCFQWLLAGAPALAEANYPTRPVQMIVPFPPGGNTDILTRIMADQYSTAFKQPFTTREVHSLAAKDVEVLEYVCAENNRDLPYLLAK